MNELQEQHDKTNERLSFLSAICLFFLGGYIFVLFLPIKFVSINELWQEFLTECCNSFYNDTRCQIDFSCKIILSNWVRAANTTSNYLQKCCYWIIPYLENTRTLYCNPYCLVNSTFLLKT